MKNAQVININGTSKDSILAFDGDSVIRDSDQTTLGKVNEISSTNVDIYFMDLMTAASVSTVSNVTMLYNSDCDFWYVSISDLNPSITFTDKHKYVGVVKDNAFPIFMREFKIEEFCIDNDSFEDTWMNLPYQVEIGAASYIRWYADNTFSGDPLFEAPAYQGGEGNVFATSAANVTHRGAVITYES